MKILHTADWHLGKKIEGRSMLENQRAALREIKEICDETRPDAVIIAGDVFDTAVPPSDAEELFFEACASLASPGRAVIALAGNHDDEVRLCAARSLAEKHNIYLVGDLDNGFFDSATVKGGEGWLKIKTASGLLNLALLPYPLESVIGGGGEDFCVRVQSAAARCAQCFSADGVNIFVSHIFMMDGSEEKLLGGARILPSSVLPAGADYIALGHIHKAVKAAKNMPAYYSGSITPCNFAETEQKSVNLVSFGKSVEINVIPLKSIKKLVRIEASDYCAAYEKLAACSDYAEILYDSTEPLTPKNLAELRALPAFVKFTPCAARATGERAARRIMTDEELFTAFYKHNRNGETPSDEDVELFLKALKGESLI